MFGREIKSPFKNIFNIKKEKIDCYHKYAKKLYKRLKKTHILAKNCIQGYTDRMKRIYNRNVYKKGYKKGDKVWK